MLAVLTSIPKDVWITLALFVAAGFVLYGLYLLNVPHGDFSVEFVDGKEVRTAHMMRCPNTAPKADIWNCMVPSP